MKVIETERLIIRNFETDDWKALQEMIIQKESSEYAIYDHPWPTSENEIKGIVEWFSKGDKFLAVCLKETGKFIGFISLNGENTEFDLGYCFNFDYHGNGYATEGCIVLLDYAFTNLNAETIKSSTAADNQPSCNLLYRLGMKKISEGIASFNKTSEGKPIEFIGYTFALTRNEWLKQSNCV
ncbi:MAG: GNAT family N-acetyltransferase [Bacteroidota bacterium]